MGWEDCEEEWRGNWVDVGVVSNRGFGVNGFL